MSPEIITSLASLGLPGIVIIGLAWAYVQERKRNDALQVKLDALQEKRVELGERVITSQGQTTAVLNGLTDLVRTLQPRGRTAS